MEKMYVRNKNFVITTNTEKDKRMLCPILCK